MYKHFVNVLVNFIFFNWEDVFCWIYNDMGKCNIHKYIVKSLEGIMPKYEGGFLQALKLLIIYIYNYHIYFYNSWKTTPYKFVYLSRFDHIFSSLLLRQKKNESRQRNGSDNEVGAIGGTYHTPALRYSECIPGISLQVPPWW